MYRDDASRWMTAAAGATLTWAMSPTRTWPPPSGRSTSRSCTPVTLLRSSGVPQTTTSKTFWFSNRLPTPKPASSVATVRRTSPGLMLNCWAFDQVDLDLQRRLQRNPLHGSICQAVNAGQQLLHLIGLGIEHLAVLAVHPNDKFGVGAVQRGSAALVEVGLHRAIQTRIAGDDLLHRGDGRVVIGGLIDADPDLGRVDVGDLIRLQGPPDPRADLADAGNGPQFGAGRRGDPGHRGPCGAVRPVEGDQQVGLPQRRHQRGGQQRDHQRPGGDDDQRDHHRGPRPRHGAVAQPGVTPLQRPDRRGRRPAHACPPSAGQAATPAPG